MGADRKAVTKPEEKILARGQRYISGPWGWTLPGHRLTSLEYELQYQLSYFAA